MGILFPKVDKPEDCQTSAEAQSIADRLMILANGRSGQAGGEFGAGFSASAASAYFEAEKYLRRAEYLRSIGK